MRFAEALRERARATRSATTERPLCSRRSLTDNPHYHATCKVDRHLRNAPSMGFKTAYLTGTCPSMPGTLGLKSSSLGRVDGEARSLPCEGEPERMRFASRADSFGRTHQDDSERSPGRRANEAVRDGASALRNWRSRVESPASILWLVQILRASLPLNPMRKTWLLGTVTNGGT